MTMHRSEHTDSDTSQRFPVTSLSSSTPVATAEVRNTDILSGRGKSYTKHPGNLRFDDIIKQNLRRYFSVSTHTDKKMITEEIVNEVTSLGRFLRHDKAQEKWLVMDREAARIKVAQALQYRQRRITKGLESIDDSLEPNPLPPSHQEHTQRRSSVQPMQAPVVASIFNQDIGLARNANCPQQEQQPRWGAAHRHRQEQICMPQQHSNNLSQSFDFDIDTSIGVAAANNQLQQQQMDQQHLARQINGLLSHRVLQHLSDTSGHHHLGPPYNAGATQQSISLLHPNDGIQAPSNVSQQHDALLLEPRPLPFHNQNAAVTGLPHRFSTDSTINRDDLLFRPMRTTSVPTSQLGNHRQPPHYTQTQQNQLLTAAPQHQEEIDNASLSDLLTEDVEDDLVSDGNEPEDWDEPTFPDGAGSTTFHR